MSAHLLEENIEELAKEIFGQMGFVIPPLRKTMCSIQLVSTDGSYRDVLLIMIGTTVRICCRTNFHIRKGLKCIGEKDFDLADPNSFYKIREFVNRTFNRQIEEA